jgi:hypothetical protein
VTIDDGSGARGSRGQAGANALLDALGDHRDRGVELIDGRVHASPHAFTTTATYRLADGTHWARTLVYGVRGGRLTEVGLYRYEITPVAALADGSRVLASPDLNRRG